jgi:hypothetical protein
MKKGKIRVRDIEKPPELDEDMYFFLVNQIVRTPDARMTEIAEIIERTINISGVTTHPVDLSGD